MKNKIKLSSVFAFLKIKKIKKPADNRISDRRKFVTSLFIEGSGIEIGALHNPLAIPETAKAKYVDRLAVPDLKKQYPELNAFELVQVDIIDDGEKLEKIENGSQDFVIANHFLEHCQNPLLALENILRVMKNGGIAYLAVPDKRYTFDIERPVTQFEHLEKDYRCGPENSKEKHFLEWVEYINNIKDEKAKRDRAIELMDMDYSIHFHTWTQSELFDFLFRARRLFSFEVEMFYKNGHEIIIILSKTK